ncbi:MAG TPA: RraA family protein [Casimicrobiaceae bacterium]|nr:RraA family protein [Casimicrobiaceae bacterium]
MSAPLSAALLQRLAAFDTPTICNALEQVAPATQATGYTHRPLLCGFPTEAPMVGYARTATIRAKAPPSGTRAEVRALRAAYYRYVEAGPAPAIVVIEDLDGPDAGFGAFWGEVQSAIHRGLGARGLVTNGSVRDIDQWAPGFGFLAGSVSPSHAYANLVAFGTAVDVAGMRVQDGDLIHADRHGAVVIPREAVDGVADAAARVAAREARILAVARAPHCTAESLLRTFDELDEIH